MNKKRLEFYVSIFLIFFFSFLAFRHLFAKGYFPIDDNTQMMRIYEMERCLKEGQFPCRLVPDLGNGYTFPLFNYYSPFVYYLGVWGRLFNISYLSIVKSLFFLSVFLSGLSFYFLSKKIFRLRFGPSIVGSFMYILTPYRAVDIYVRGDLAESWAFVFLPLLVGMTFEIAKKKITKKKLIVYNLILAAFLITHTVSLITLFIPLLIWVSFLFFIAPSKILFLKNFLSLTPAVGLASFYLLPAAFERRLVTIKTMFSGYFNYLNHYVSLKQLFFSRYWGYGGSNVLDNDTMSFQLGWPHWWLVGVFFAFLFFRLVIFSKNKGLKRGILSFLNTYKLELSFSFIYLLSVFFCHAKSYPFWRILPFLGYLQFPWRFLLPAVFFQALIITFLMKHFSQLFKRTVNLFVFLLIVLITLGLNFSYFQPEVLWPNFSDQTFFQTKYFTNQQQAIIHDYLPTKVKVLPKVNQFPQPVVLMGKAEISDWQLKSNYWKFEAGINKQAIIMIPVFDYPHWQVVLNGRPISHQTDQKYGFITISIGGSGKYHLQGFFLDTPIRRLANTISLLSSVPLFLWAL